MTSQNHIFQDKELIGASYMLHYTLFRSSVSEFARKHSADADANKTGVKGIGKSHVRLGIRKVKRRDFPSKFSGSQIAVRHLSCRILRVLGAIMLLSKRSLRQLGRPRLSQSGERRASGTVYHALQRLRGDLSNSVEIRKCRGVRA